MMRKEGKYKNKSGATQAPLNRLLLPKIKSRAFRAVKEQPAFQPVFQRGEGDTVQ